METKNLIRQNFISEDIGENKAKVLSERYTEIYPKIFVSYIDKYATYSAFDTRYLKENTYPEEFFVDIDTLGLKPEDILINLVDNEGFKKKLDVYCKEHLNPLFAAGVNLFNGQAYYSCNKNTNGYVMDHVDLLEIFDEVSVHACADTDANGTDDNPEQLFNGNDVAASVLSNLYQTVLTDIPLYKKINFTTGLNMSVTTGDTNYSNLLHWINHLSNNEDSVDFLVLKARKFVERFGLEKTTESAKFYYDIYHKNNQYQKITDIFN